MIDELSNAHISGKYFVWTWWVLLNYYEYTESLKGILTAFYDSN